jgi:hypothetical protein
MGQGSPQALRRSFLEVPQHSIHAAHIDSGVATSDVMGALPAAFVFDEPITLLRAE